MCYACKVILCKNFIYCFSRIELSLIWKLAIYYVLLCILTYHKASHTALSIFFSDFCCVLSMFLASLPMSCNGILC